MDGLMQTAGMFFLIYLSVCGLIWNMSAVVDKINEK